MTAAEKLRTVAYLDGLFMEHDRLVARLHQLDAAMATAPSFSVIGEKIDALRDLMLVEHSIREYASARAPRTAAANGLTGVDWRVAPSAGGVS